jgi:hypothetical protein
MADRGATEAEGLGKIMALRLAVPDAVTTPKDACPGKQQQGGGLTREELDYYTFHYKVRRGRSEGS